jgi:hypothetical protein
MADEQNLSAVRDIMVIMLATGLAADGYLAIGQGMTGRSTEEGAT